MRRFRIPGLQGAFGQSLPIDDGTLALRRMLPPVPLSIDPSPPLPMTATRCRARRLAASGALALIVGALGLAGASADTGDAWDAALRRGCPAGALQPIPLLQGCGPTGCGTWLGPLFVSADGAGLQRRAGQLLPLVNGPLPAADLPELNWTPLRAYTVRIGRGAGRSTWGQCLEFTHSGLGNSGRAQRWRSVLLVANGSTSAQRVVGYQASCAALCSGPIAGEVMLPSVQPVVPGQPALHVIWSRCGAGACEHHVDERTVEGRADSDSGMLMLRP